MAVAGLAASMAAWGYHAWVARSEEGAGPGTQGLRAYRYLMAAVGLGTLAVGMVYLLATLIGLAAPSGRVFLPDVRWWSGEMAAALTALLVGGPLWAYQWRRLQREAGTDEERHSLPRRLTIFIVFGASVLSAMGAFVALLSLLLLRLFEGELTAYVVYDLRWAVAVLLTAGAVGGYYALVLREDRAAAPERPRARRTPPQARLARRKRRRPRPGRRPAPPNGLARYAAGARRRAARAGRGRGRAHRTHRRRAVVRRAGDARRCGRRGDGVPPGVRRRCGMWARGRLIVRRV